MCGLVAILSRRGPVARETLERSISRIAHRGPDGQGFHLSPGGEVGLAHARLAIIDLETGAQPITNEAEDLFAIVNGELYDHDRIRAELEARGHHLRTRSDSELVLHLYEELGVHCVRELRGEFAFVLWDARRKALFAARDRFGIKPLYYAETADGLFLASEAKALFAAGVPARWDPRAFFESMTCQVPLAAEQTVFAGVQQLPPGAFMVATATSVSVRSYWTPSFATSPAGSTEELLPRLEDAVRLRLRADVPVGVYLSGGVDSSLILALAARHAGRSLRAFTIGFEDREVDELDVAERTARHLGVELVPFRATHDLLADHFMDAVEHSECAHDNPHGAAKYLLSRHVRDHGVKVVLAGEGSDELFLGYPWLVLDLLKHDVKAERPAAIAARLGPRAAGAVAGITAVAQFAARHPSMVRVRRTLGFIPSFLALAAASFLRPEVPAMMRRELRPNVDPLETLLASLDLEQLRGREAARQSAYLQLRTYFASYNLNVLGDRMEMAHGVEGRLPFLDHVFFETARALPAAACFRDPLDKAPVRELARSLIPEDVATRPKWAFVAPDVMKDRGRLGELVRDVLHGPTLRDHTLYDQKAVLEALEKTASMPVVQSRLACTVVSACVLEERFRLT